MARFLHSISIFRSLSFSLYTYIYIYLCIYIYIYIYYARRRVILTSDGRPGSGEHAAKKPEIVHRPPEFSSFEIRLRLWISSFFVWGFAVTLGRGMLRLEALIELKFINLSFSNSNFSIRAFRACPPIEHRKQLLVEQFEASRALRGSSISVGSTLPPLLNSAKPRRATE